MLNFDEGRYVGIQSGAIGLAERIDHAVAEALAAGALEAERGGVHEHDGELAEQVAPAREQRLLDLVLDAARAKGVAWAWPPSAASSSPPSQAMAR